MSSLAKIPLYHTDPIAAAESRKFDAQCLMEAASARVHKLNQELGLARRLYNQARRDYERALNHYLSLVEGEDVQKDMHA